MIQVASTSSFEVVRDRFFNSYIKNKASTESSDKGQDPWGSAVNNFVINTRDVCKDYRDHYRANSDDIKIVLEKLLKKPGTPYQKVGYALEWFKEWRKEQRGAHASKTSKDTKHDKLQSALTELLVDVSYAIIAEQKTLPTDAILAWRGQSTDSAQKAPPALERPTIFCNYYNTRNSTKAVYAQKRRDDFFEKSKAYKELLNDASPWRIVMDWEWKNSVCHHSKNVVSSKTVPPLYVMSRYLLNSTPENWDRQFFCDALVMEKTCTFNAPALSGLDIGMRPRSTMDIVDYQEFWDKQERIAAKDWRYIRRNSLFLCTGNTRINNITIGDAVALLRAKGPSQVVTGVFKWEDTEVKTLLLERLQVDLGKKYTMLSQLEESMGPMPEVVASSLEEAMASSKETIEYSSIDMENLFS